MEQQDGTLLDEKTATIEVKGAATPVTTPQHTTPAKGPLGIPGFTWTLGATAMTLSAVLAFRRKM
jgi:hypothetical protein